MKDNFSTHADQYAKYRPSYPNDLYDFILSFVNDKHHAWDCGTGNGQVAQQLSIYFDKVFASDISQSQLKNAVKRDNITYSIQPAERTNFPSNFFDLIVVAQAIHWFNFEQFYREVNRTLKDDGVLAVIGYGLIQISPDIDRVISNLYHHTLGPFWDAERKYIDENYQTIPFPFKEQSELPSFNNSLDWTLEHLIGYLETWSAVSHFVKTKGYNPISAIYNDLRKNGGEPTTRKAYFQILLRVGRK